MSKASKRDNQLAKEAVYATNGEGPCPYPDGTRLWKMWWKWRSHYVAMENIFDEFAEVYGEFRSDRMAE